MKIFLSIFRLMILILSILFTPITVWAVKPELVTTFESIGISWAPANLGSGQQAKVHYRLQGSGTWRNAQDLWYDDRGGNYVNEYRGSIVNVNSGTVYEVKLTLSPNGETVTALASTWSETFPVGTTVELPPVTNGTYTINQSGSQGAYRLYTFGSNGSALVDAGRANNYGIDVAENVHHVIVRGLTVTGALVHGILLRQGSHDIVVEDNTITNWGTEHNAACTAENEPKDCCTGDGQGTCNGTYWCKGYPDGNGSDPVCNMQMGIASGTYGTNGETWTTAGYRYIIQRNTIHTPAGDTNAWDQPSLWTHPRGPHGIGLRNSAGQNVIRYNNIYGTAEHMFNDCMGWENNFSAQGFPGPNSDIYGNSISHCQDDAIEADGGGENVRIWNNYMKDTFDGISAVVLEIGPMYVWRNVFGRSRHLQKQSASDNYGRGYAFKLSEAAGIGNARMYIYHNTLLQEAAIAPNKRELGFNFFIQSSNDGINNTVVYNNISDTSYYSDAKPDGIHFNGGGGNSCSNDIDYNLYTGLIQTNCVSDPHESDGGIKSNPTYAPATFFAPAVNEFTQALAAGSPGYDAGIVLPNFNDGYGGAGPDMGAVEHGQTLIIFGINIHRSANGK